MATGAGGGGGAGFSPTETAAEDEAVTSVSDSSERHGPGRSGAETPSHVNKRT